MNQNDQTPPLTGKLVILPDHVGADDIIAPDYLAFDLDDPDQRMLLARHALIDLLPDPDALVGPPDSAIRETFVFAGHRFGHGSARAHGPVALAAAGVKLVIARSFSPPFARTAINLGCFHCLTPRDPDTPAPPGAADATLEWTLPNPTLSGNGFRILLADPGVTRAIVESGGLLTHLAQSKAALP